MRVASTLDVLDERPTTWPKPPPGFTTKRVLGPGSDFPKRRRRKAAKRRRRNHGGGGDGGGGNRRYSNERGDNYHPNNRDNSIDYDSTAGEHPALSQGLKSSRAGFSVEELEAERQLKANASNSKQ